MRTRLLGVLLVHAISGSAFAVEVISPAHRHSWGENIGWMDWRIGGEPPGAEGVRVHATILSGFIWGENVGWIHVGDGSPAAGAHYGNLDGSDFGVNIDTNGDLFGYAWGENIGWVQFDTRSLGGSRVRLDRAAQRFRGFAWGENIGWINLDDDEHYVGIAPEGVGFFRRGDANTDTRVDIADPIHSIGCLFLHGTCTECLDAGDSNDDGRYDIADPVHTLNWLFRGGPQPPAPGPDTCGDDAATDDVLADCRYDACF